MMTEELNYRGGLLSGLAAEDELNRLLDELYVDGLEQPDVRGEAVLRIPGFTPQYHDRVPNGFEEFIEWVEKLEAELEEEKETERVLEPAPTF